MLAATSDFNHPSEDYVNYISINLLAGMIVKTVVVKSWIQILDQASNIVPTPI